MYSLRLPKDSRFTNKEMIFFLFPVIFEQLMVALLGISDTFMVSAKLGPTALAGVALVNRLDNFSKQFLLAFAQGGSVVLAQYIGAQNEKYSRISLKSNIQILVGIGTFFMLLMVVFKKQIVTIFFGGAEKEVIEIALRYFTFTVISYPFAALYYAGGSLFRVMGESRIPFISSVAMMSLNLLLKYIFIFHLELGVTGATLSTIISMAVVGFILLIRLTRKKTRVRLTPNWEFDAGTSAKVIKVAFPNGIEQGLFQLGAILLAGLVSGLGRDAINADQIARNLSPVVACLSSAFGALILMVTGQCLGAGKPDEAVMFKKHIIKLQYVFALCASLIFIIITKPAISIFNVSEQTKEWVYQILVLYNIGTLLVYAPAFTTPSALRGAGDTSFVMIVSGLSMLIFRISVAYLLVKVFDAGVISIWVAMISDWVIQSVIFEIRYRRGKWKRLNVI